MGTMQEFRAVVALLRSGAIRPVIDQVLPPERGAEAYARLEAGSQFGKVLVDWR
jgi:NADPH:quinone reductase-like Zn-dependent oxidoreductase